MKESLNDISPTGGRKPLDLAALFHRVRAYAIHHHAAHPLRDFTRAHVLRDRLDVSRQKFVKISALGNQTTEDIHTNQKPPEFSWGTVVRGFLGKPLRTRRTYAPVIEAIRPFDKPLPLHSLDVRPLTRIASSGIYGDITQFPVSTGVKIRRSIRRNARWVVRTVALTVVVGYACLLGLMGIRGYVEYTTLSAYQELQSLRDISDIGHLKTTIDSIHQKLFVVDMLFTPFGVLADNSIIAIPEVDKARRVIHGGYEVSRILSLAFGIYGDLMHDLYGENWFGKTFQVGDIETHNLAITDLLIREKPTLDEIRTRLHSAIADYSSVGTLGNDTIDQKMEKFLGEAVAIEQAYDYGLDHFDVLLALLGDTKPQRYVILNQNRDELRVGGGFPGTAITVEVYKGRVTRYAQNDIYDFDWKLYPYHEDPPEGINAITTNFGLRDANYYPEFDQTFNKVNFFYEKAGGGTIDTLVGINQGIIVDFLKKYGPIALPKYGLTIDDKNFSVIISTLVESKIVPYTQTAVNNFISPKAVLFDFMEAFKERLIERRDLSGYLGIIENNLQSNEILVVSRTPTVRSYLKNLGILELWRRDPGNWAYPVFTSLSGNKSDRYMDRTFEVHSRQVDPCTVENVFTLDSRHTFSDKDAAVVRNLLGDFSVPKKQQDEILRIEGNGDNRHYVRILVPPNARLTGALGSDIGIDYASGATTFSFYTAVPVGGESRVTFTYQVSPKNCEGTFRMYKQPGLVNFRVVSD